MNADEPPAEGRHPDVHLADDVLPHTRLLVTVVVTVAVTIALCVICWLILYGRLGQLRPGRAFPERDLPAPHTVSMVRQEPFLMPRPGPTLNDEKRRILESWGWVDRGQRIVHIPISHAMDIVAAGGGR